MDLENAKAQMRKGILEFCILCVFEDGEHYPIEVLDKLKKANLQVMEGVVYTILTRLKNDGLLSHRWEEASGGPPRKYYSLTEEGRKILVELAKTWVDLSTSVNQIFNRGSEISKQENIIQ